MVLLRLSLIFLLAALMASACSKGDKKESSAGNTADIKPEDDDPPDFGKQSTAPCLRLQDGEDDDLSDEPSSDVDDVDDEELSEVLPADSECDRPNQGSGNANRELRITTTLDECEEQNKSWSPIGGGSTSACGAPLVDWCCTLENIRARYPNMNGEAKSSLARLETSDLLLYHCSLNGDKLEFHFASQVGKEIKYEYVWISKTSPKEPAGEGEFCSSVSMSDMGFPDPSEDGDEVPTDDDPEETSEETPEETPEANPEETPQQESGDSTGAL